MKKNKRAIIIGASSGIGEALVPVLSGQDYDLGIVARREDVLISIAKKYNTLYRAFDVTDFQNAISQVDLLIDELGGLDLFIFSAGEIQSSADHDFIKENGVIQTNISGFVNLIGHVYMYFKSKNCGHIVGISSVAGLTHSAYNNVYNSSKAFEIGYLKGLRLQAKKERVRVHITDIRPGYVKTDMIRGNQNTFWETTPEEAAKLIFRFIKKKRKVGLVPQKWWVVVLLLKCFSANQIHRLFNSTFLKKL